MIRQSAYLGFKQIMVDKFASFFYCAPVSSAQYYDGLDLKLFILGFLV